MNFKKKSKGLAIGFFLLGFLTLVLGDYFFAEKPSTILSGVKVYIIPLTFVLIATNLTGNTAVYFQGKGFFKGFSLGLLAMSVPLVFSFFSQVLPHLGKPLPQNWPTLLATLILLNLCIGFFEESLFRNLILNTLLEESSLKSYREAFYGSAILFGLIHMGNLTLEPHRPLAIVTQIIYATMLGILFAALYLYTKNIWAVIVLHALTDFISSYPRLYETNASLAGNVKDLSVVEAGLTILLIVPSFIIGLLIFKRVKRKFSLAFS